MIQHKITIVNKLGLHARAAAKLVMVASKYASEVNILCNKTTVNGKSIMGVMMLAAAKGSVIELIISGSDEQQTLEALQTIINNRFDESE